MRPFILSLLAGIWFVVLNILNACTQPPAQVVLNTSSSSQQTAYIQPRPIELISQANAAPVEPVRKAELPPLLLDTINTIHPVKSEKAPTPVKRPKEEFTSLPNDPSIAEIIETGERLTLGNEIRQVTVSSPVPVLKQLASATFVWPVRGTIISKFGSKPGGIRNDGINIAAKEGTPIKAIADGKALYMNEDMKGYGNLILIRHTNGWISTYAHNKNIIITQGTEVKQGDVIAYIGHSGSVSSPQLHFSLRKDKKPVNPERYLATNFAHN